MKDSEVLSLALLRKKTNVGQHVLHLFIGELPTPGMHRAEDDAVLDCAQQFLV